MIQVPQINGIEIELADWVATPESIQQSVVQFLVARGGQPGHAGNQPKFYDLSAGDIVHEHIPTVCTICAEALMGKDEAPYRHQILELPVLRPQITEHRLHQLNCEHCGTATRAKLPDSVGVSH